MIHSSDPNSDTAQSQANNQSQQLVDQRQMEGTEREENSAQNADFAIPKPEKPSSALAQPQQTLQTEPKEDPLQILFKQTLSSVKALTNQCQFQGGMTPGADLTLSANARPTLIPIFTRNTKLSFGPPTNFIIDPPSEGKERYSPISKPPYNQRTSEESEEEIIQPPDIVQRYDEKGGPSLIDVVDRIVDPSYLVPTTKFNEIPKGIKPMLLIQNIRSDYRAQQLKDRLEYYFDKINMRQVHFPQLLQGHRRIQPMSIHMIKLNQINQQIKSALIHYEKTSDVQQVFEALQKKENYQATGSFANMKYLTHLEQESYCWNKKQLEQERWVGVVLRNFPPTCTDETLVKNLSKDANYKIMSCETSQEIKGQKCGILRMPDIEQAEKLCKRWNNYSFTLSKRLKAHIHPFSYPKRPKPETSHHMLFQKYKQHFRSSGEESSRVYEPQKPKLEDMLGQLSNLYQKAPQNISPPKSQHQEVLPPQIHSQPGGNRPVKLEDTTIKSKSAAIQPKEVNLQQISEEHSLSGKRGSEQTAPRNSAAAPESLEQRRKEQLDLQTEEDPVGALLSIRQKKIAPNQPTGLAALVPPSQQKAVKQPQTVSQSSSKQPEHAFLEEVTPGQPSPQKRVQKKTQIENRAKLSTTTTASSVPKGDYKATNNNTIERKDQPTQKETSEVKSKEALQEEDKRKDNSSNSNESDSKIIGKRKLRKLSDEDMMVRQGGRSRKRQRIVESSHSSQEDEDDSKSSGKSSKEEEYTWEDMDREESIKEQPKKRSTRPPRRQSSGRGGSSQKTSKQRSKVVKEKGLTEQPKRRGRPSKKRSSTNLNKDQVFQFPSGTNGNDKVYPENTINQGVSPSKKPTQLQKTSTINQVTSEAEARGTSQKMNKEKSQQQSGTVNGSENININVQANHIQNGSEKGEQLWNPQ